MAGLDAARTLARSVSVTPTEAQRHGVAVNRDGQRRSAFDLLAYPKLGLADIARIWPAFGDLAPDIAAQLEIDAKYAVYLDRQAEDVAAYRRDESLALPDDLDFQQISGLSSEMKHKFTAFRPRTVGQAGRLDGVTPAALTLLAAHVRRRGRPKAARTS
jgi:tRNA uridine 5-carboxymethylaminomethyl modification enzyme